MGGFHYDKKGYPRWNDSDIPVHRTVDANMHGGHYAGHGTDVHHRDGDKGNFKRSNLTRMSHSAHSSYHSRRRH